MLYQTHATASRTHRIARIYHDARTASKNGIASRIGIYRRRRSTQDARTSIAKETHRDKYRAISLYIATARTLSARDGIATARYRSASRTASLSSLSHLNVT
jgi:hypothetical protein